MDKLSRIILSQAMEQWQLWSLGWLSGLGALWAQDNLGDWFWLYPPISLSVFATLGFFWQIVRKHGLDTPDE